MKEYLKILTAPILIALFVFVLGIFWKMLNLPPQEELIPIINNYFDKYGILLVFISAIIESGFVLGVYLPGGLVIFLGVIFSIGEPLQAILIVIAVIIGFMIGFSIDFFLGKYGWYKIFLHFGFEKALIKTRERLEKYNLSTVWFGYHHPDVGSLVSTTHGIMQYSFKKFILITLPPVIAWSIFWGTLAYILGNKVLGFIGYKTLLVILGVWIIARIVELKLEKTKLNIK